MDVKNRPPYPMHYSHIPFERLIRVGSDEEVSSGDEADFTITLIDQETDMIGRYLIKVPMSDGSRRRCSSSADSLSTVEEPTVARFSRRLAQDDSKGVDSSRKAKDTRKSKEQEENKRLSQDSVSSGDGNEGVSRYGRQQKRKIDDDYVTWREEDSEPPPKLMKLTQSPGTPVGEVPQKGSTKSSVVSSNKRGVPKSLQTPAVELPRTPVAQILKSPDVQTPQSSGTGSPSTEGDVYLAGDVVWARLGGFPFWPSVVIPDYALDPPCITKTVQKGVNQQVLYHVMFLEDNGAHSWVPRANTAKFLGPSVATLQRQLLQRKMSPGVKAFKVSSTYQVRWNKALTEAEEASKMTPEDRREAYCPHFDDAVIDDLLTKDSEEVEAGETSSVRAKGETPKTATAKAETPKSATAKAETPKTATAKAETPKTATAKAETPKSATAKGDTPKSETAKSETPKKKRGRPSLSIPPGKAKEDSKMAGTKRKSQSLTSESKQNLQSTEKPKKLQAKEGHDLTTNRTEEEAT